jgi:hypothetical protein
MGEEVKAVKMEEPKKEIVIGPIKGGLPKRTLKELQSLDIHLNDVFSVRNFSLNLTWEKLIRLINFNADKKVLTWNHTFEETVELIGIFLM